MPPVSKKQILATLAPYLPDGHAEDIFRAALAEAGLPPRPAYSPQEVAVIGAAIMRQAQTLGAVAIAESLS